MTEVELRRRLYDHAPLLRAHIRSRMRPALERILTVDDVLQDVWINAFRRFLAYGTSGIRSFEAWLTSIADRLLIDSLRTLESVKRGSAAVRIQPASALTSSLLNIFERVVSPRRTPSSEVAMREAVMAVRIAVADLPPRQRRAISLRHIEGRPYEEIADCMNCTVPAVHGLLSRGLQRLRSDLADPARFFSDVEWTETDSAEA